MFQFLFVALIVKTSCFRSVSVSKSSPDEVTPSTPQPTSSGSPELNKKPTNNKPDSDFSSNSVFASVLTSFMSGGGKEVEKQPDAAGPSETCQDGYEFIENSIGRRSTSSLNDFKDDNNAANEQNVKLNKSSSRTSLPLRDAALGNINLTSNVMTAKKVKSNTNSFCQNNKDEALSRLESVLTSACVKSFVSNNVICKTYLR